MKQINDTLFIKSVSFKDIIQLRFLFDLLCEREPSINISHDLIVKELYTFDKHCQFVISNPYWKWFVVYKDNNPIGSFYLTTKKNLSGRAIGIFIKNTEQKNGYGTAILNYIKEKYKKERLLANIAPNNLISQKFFAKQGFKKIQITYKLENK